MKRTIAFKNACQKGFTLAELAILLAILGIIAGSMMLEMVSGSAVGAQETTVKRVQAIQKNMLALYTSSGRLPCPAPGNPALDDGDYGRETGIPGQCNSAGGAFLGAISPTCTGTSCSACSNMNCGAVLGTVPVKALNLPDEYALDGWGRRFTYVVDERFTLPQSPPMPTPSLIVNDRNGGGAVLIGHFPAIIISHGKSGNGAFPVNGSSVANRMSTLTPNANETDNISSGQFNNVFVLQSFRPDLLSGSGRFDQVVQPIPLPNVPR